MVSQFRYPNLMNQPTKYSVVGRTIHWLTAIGVLTAFILGPGGPERVVYSASHQLGREFHETLGLCVFALVVIRVFWRMGARRPPPPDVPAWMSFAAKAVQVGLYLLMFALPITAISGAWLEGHDLTLVGGINISPWIGSSHQLGKTIVHIHTFLGDAIIWLAGFHASAALFHHTILQDDVLSTMLPAWIAERIPRL